MNNTVYEHGINDMPRGWIKENKWNKIIYKKWCGMLERCYSYKFYNKHPTYINCTLCLEWHYLSKFVEDFKNINGYDEEKLLNGELELDKDIKSNGRNKEYSLENCTLVTKSENIKQAMKTRNNDYLNGDNHHMYGKFGEDNPNYGSKRSKETKQKMSKAQKYEKHHSAKKVIQYDKDGNFIKIWNCIKQAEDELNIRHIVECCKWYELNENKDEWYKRYKNYPNKSVGGFIWKYYNGDDINE